MRRAVDLFLWILVLALPALIALGVTSEATDTTVEQVFVESLGLHDGIADTPSSSLAPAWYEFFYGLQARLGSPGWLGKPLSVGAAWLLTAAAFAVLVAGGLGRLGAAVSLVVLALHPQLRSSGAMMTPWLPAFAFMLLGLAFLQGMVLPTVVLRRRSPARWGPRLLAILGCGLSLGLASSAESRMAWIMLVPSGLLTLSMIAVGLTLWRLRRAVPPSGFLLNPWAILRRTLPWAACWFFVLLLLVTIHEALAVSGSERLLAWVAAPGTLELALAWASLPGIVWLGYREGQRLGFRSQLGGSTVLFVCLAALWFKGPAWNTHAGPLERLFAAPVFAASVASWLRWRG